MGISDQGNLVRVRDRFWVVESVVPSRPLPSSTNGTSTEAHHAMRLVPVDDKGSADPLTVFWELEPGTEIRPQASLPDSANGLDDSETFPQPGHSDQVADAAEALDDHRRLLMVAE